MRVVVEEFDPPMAAAAVPQLPLAPLLLRCEQTFDRAGLGERTVSKHFRICSVERHFRSFAASRSSLPSPMRRIVNSVEPHLTPASSFNLQTHLGFRYSKLCLKIESE
jgi:hypothetical protein